MAIAAEVAPADVVEHYQRQIAAANLRGQDPGWQGREKGAASWAEQGFWP
jgi:hypothetical protein